MGVVKQAIADATMTSMWVFTLPLVLLLSTKISTHLGLEPFSLPTLFITINSVATLLYVFSNIGHALGGASFNPASSISFFAAGVRKPGDSSLLMKMAASLPAQAVGAVVGAKGILQVMPVEYQHRLKGPVLKVDLLTGAIAEGVMTFVLCFYLLLVMLKGPKWLIAKVWLVASTTAGLVMIGSGLTGPSMNPANAFGWAYIKNQHTTRELYYVYWVGPLVGAVLAGWVFGIVFGEPVKQKKA